MVGGFGTVYKGTVAGETLVAVKRLDRALSHGEREFITEVNTIGSMHHMNLVRLCGYCSEDSHRYDLEDFYKTFYSVFKQTDLNKCFFGDITGF